VLQTTFIAPVSGKGMHVRARVLRSGKSTVHVEAQILEGESVGAIAIGIFGKSRPSEIRVAPRPWPVDSASPAIDMSQTRGDLPAFLQHFSARWLRGAPPGSSSPLPEAIVEVGLRDSGPTTEAHVLAIADATPPVALSMLKTFTPGSSLTWTLEMLREDRFAELMLAGWRLDVEIVAGGSGYTSQSEIVWGPGGEPVALSAQCMVVFG